MDYNVSVVTARGTVTVSDIDFQSRAKAVAAFHTAAKQWIATPDACVSLGRRSGGGPDWRSFTTLAVKYTDANRVELTAEYYV